MFKKFLYFLLDEQGRSYFMQNKTLQQSAMPKALPETPEGWQDVQIGWERDMKKLGVARTFTLPLQLRLTVMKMVRSLVFSRSTEEKIFLLIQKLHCTTEGGTFQFLYKYLYKGEFDLSAFKYDDEKDSCPLVEGGTRKLVTANEGTTYEIDIDSDPEVQVVRMDGINIENAGQFIVQDGFPKDAGDTIYYLGNHIAEMNMFQSEVEAAFIKSTYRTKVGNLNSDIRATGEWFLKATSQTNVSFTYDFWINLVFDTGLGGGMNPAASYVLIVRCIKADNNIRWQQRLYGQTASNWQNGDKHIAGTFNQTIMPGDELYLYSSMNPQGLTGDAQLFVHYTHVDTSIFKIRYLFKRPTSYINALKPSTVLKRLAEKIGLQASDVETTFLQKWDHLLLTSGDGNRGLAGAKLKTSLNTFTDFVRIVMAGGQGIENGVLKFGAYEYFLDPTDPIALGDVKGLKCYPAKDLRGNVLKIGYQEKQVDDINGKYSFNNTQVRTLPITRDVQELGYVCSYVADPYYIEINRVNLQGKTTTDNESDNEVIVLSTVNITFYLSAQVSGSTLVLSGSMDTDLLSRSRQLTVTNSPLNNGTYTIKSVTIAGGVATVTVAETLRDEAGMISVTPSAHLLKRYPYSAVSGVPDPGTIFNIEDLSPMRLIKRQGRYLNSICDGLQGRAIAYQSTGKNNELKTTFNGQVTEEKADYLVSAPKLFKPWYFELETTVPQDLAETLEQTPNRAFSFTWYGVTYTGFLVRAALSPNDNRSQTLKLLSAPDNDLTTLINSYG